MTHGSRRLPDLLQKSAITSSNFLKFHRILIPQYTEYSTVSSIHRVQYSVLNTQSTVQCPQYTGYGTVSSIHRLYSTVSSIHRIQYSVLNTQDTVQCPQYTGEYSVLNTQDSTVSSIHRRVQCSQYTGQYSVLNTLGTVHSVQNTTCAFKRTRIFSPTFTLSVSLR